MAEEIKSEGSPESRTPRPARAGLRMPELVGMPLTRARRVLEFYGVGVRLQLVERPGPQGSIFAQLPEPGTRVTPGETVLLAVRQESPVQYLPEIFQQEDEATKDARGNARNPLFLRRFLMMIQQQYHGLETTVETLHETFDPARAPRRMLPWLARFLPIELDASWSTDKVRQVMLQAPALLAQRGTAQGLEAMIQLYFDMKVTVHENAWPHRGVVVGRSQVGGLVCVSTVPPPPLALYVEVPAEVALDTVAWERLLRLVDREKPAHLRACVVRAPARSTAENSPRHSVVGQLVVGQAPSP